MRCPRCAEPLVPQPAGRKAVLHACARHEGVFATAQDLRLILPVASHATLQDAMRASTPGSLPCPGCSGTMWSYVATRGADRIELDSCPACGGTWFDGGELERAKAQPRIAARAPAQNVPQGALGFAGAGSAMGAIADPWTIGMLFQAIAGLLDWG